MTLARSAFIIYLGYKISISKAQLNLKKDLDKPTFAEGFLLQWLNPKAWIACVSGISLFTSIYSFVPLVTFISVYFMISYASLALWAVAGEKCAFILNNEKRLKLFNFSMGALLMITALYLVWVQLVLPER